MIKIYGSTMSTAGRCIWMAEEAGQPIENVILDWAKGEMKSPEYLKLNPNGKVPTMVDGDLVMFESLAINGYLAEKYKPEMMGPTIEDRARVSMWSYWGIANLSHAGEAVILQKYRNTPESDETTRSRETLAKLLPILDNALTGKNYLVADMFTVADLNNADIVRGLGWAGIDMTPYANITRWMTTIAQRPAYQKTIGAKQA